MKEWINRVRFNVLEWSLQSQDLNPTEKRWTVFNKQVCARKLELGRTLVELQWFCQDMWLNIQAESCGWISKVQYAYSQQVSRYFEKNRQIYHWTKLLDLRTAMIYVIFTSEHKLSSTIENSSKILIQPLRWSYLITVILIKFPIEKKKVRLFVIQV